LDGAPDPVLVIDGAQRVLYANPAVQAVLDWSGERLLASQASMFVAEAGGFEEMVGSYRSVPRQEFEVLHGDGSPRWVSVSVNPLRLADRTFAGAVLFLRDETESRRTRSELARKNAELEQTVRAVSHELRSPLVALLGFSRLLREDYGGEFDEKGRHFVERIEQAARTMEVLIRDFLELSRIGDGEEAAPSLADSRQVLLQLQAELKPRLDAQRVHLDLPAESPLIHCDRTRLYQIFSNLIGNALQHMGPHREPRIEVRVSEEPFLHRITVSDNGQGIDPVHHERIFQMFQVLKRTEARQGTGVGLAVVRKIAEVYGGKAWVESEAGSGAAFHVTIARR
jgi:PAS domain S-box-containing protein